MPFPHLVKSDCHTSSRNHKHYTQILQDVHSTVTLRVHSLNNKKQFDAICMFLEGKNKYLIEWF
jgi:hypothetical protein